MLQSLQLLDGMFQTHILLKSNNREQHGARSVSFFDGWFGWFQCQESFDWQPSTVSRFALQKAKRHRTEANLETICSYGWGQGIEELYFFSCYSNGWSGSEDLHSVLQQYFVGANCCCLLNSQCGEDWRDEPWEYKNEQYEACGDLQSFCRFFLVPVFLPDQELLKYWNWTLRFALRSIGAPISKDCSEAYYRRQGICSEDNPQSLSRFLVCKCRHRKRIRIWRTCRTDHTCGSLSWNMSSSLGEDPTACAFFSATQCHNAHGMPIKVSTSWWGRLP